MRAAAATAALAGLSLCACDLRFPDEWAIEDLRILEVRADPPEIAIFERGADPIALDPRAALDLRPVHYTAVVAHPDLDASFTYDWIACAPGLDRVPCGGADRRRLTETPTASFSVSPVALLLEELGPSPGMDQLVTLAKSLSQDPRDLINGFWAYMNVQARVDRAALPVDTLSLEATKRVVIYDPKIVAAALRSAQQITPGSIPVIDGVDLPSLCVGVSDAQLEELYAFLRTRVPNQRPIYTGLEAACFDPGQTEASTGKLIFGETIEVRPGAQLRLKGLVPGGTAEKYQVIDANCDLQEFTEELSWSWFTNAGTLSRQLTTEDRDSTTWEAPQEQQIQGESLRVKIWTVLRDGRGGSDHRIIDVLVRKGGASCTDAPIDRGAGLL